MKSRRSVEATTSETVPRPRKIVFEELGRVSASVDFNRRSRSKVLFTMKFIFLLLLLSGTGLTATYHVFNAGYS